MQSILNFVPLKTKFFSEKRTFGGNATKIVTKTFKFFHHSVRSVGSVLSVRREESKIQQLS